MPVLCSFRARRIGLDRSRFDAFPNRFWSSTEDLFGSAGGRFMMACSRGCAV